MFIGEFHHALDEKGRMMIPVSFRSGVAGGAVVTRGLDHSLFVYPKAEWLVLAEKLANLPMGQADTRAFARLMLAGAMEVEVDRSGRINVPEYLRIYAGLKKDVVVAGLYNRMEIWDEEIWRAYVEKTEAQGDAIAERLTNLAV